MERLQQEFEAIGFYLSAHPLDSFTALLGRKKVVSFSDLPRVAARETGRKALAGIVLAKSLHPEILFHISEWLSGTSRSANRDEAHEIEAKGQTWLEKNTSPDWDLALMGHVHHPFMVSVGDKSLAALAGWFDTLGYAVWQNGQFQLLDFDRNPFPFSD